MKKDPHRRCSCSCGSSKAAGGTLRAVPHSFMSTYLRGMSKKRAEQRRERRPALARAFAEAHDVPCGGISMAATGGSLIGVLRCARFETGLRCAVLRIVPSFIS